MQDTLPVYPTYTKITIENKDFFTTFCNRYPPYSDFNLLSLLSWDAAGTNVFSTLNGNLVVRIKDYLTDGFLYSLLGENDIDTSLLTLLKDTDKLSFVPEYVVERIKNKDKFNIVEDRDNDDYMLSSEKISKLDGHCFRHLRQDVLKFKRLYPNYEVRQISLLDPTVLKDVLALSEKWFKAKDFDTAKCNEEMSILHNFVTYSAVFNCLYLGFYVDNKLVAYIFNEVLPTKTVISHFGVSDSSYECSSPMMEYVTAKYLFEHGYNYQNQEQDAGLPGLRTAKLFYNPEYFLKKYTITLA